ncbi:CG18764, partial [Drosophila busckii]
MTLQCRTCAKVIYNTNAKNLFDMENKPLLQNVEMVAGTTLINDPELPTRICGCCLLDLNRALNHIQIFRDRFIKTQELLINCQILEDPGYCESENESEKLGNKEISKDSTTEQLKEELQDELLREEENNMTEFFEDNAQHADDLIASVQKEMYSDDSQGTIDKEYEALTDSEIPIETGQTYTPKTNNAGTLKMKKKYCSWKNLTEEQIVERKRQQRKRDCVCEVCGRYFNDQSNFKLHMLRHTGIKNYDCSQCDKLFYTEHLLQLHERIAHQGERPYSCKYCSKTFQSSTSRVIHERLHTNERPYSCEFCDKTFFSGSALNRHELIHTGVRLFSCDLCNKTFQRNTHLKAHLRSKMHEKVTKIVVQN